MHRDLDLGQHFHPPIEIGVVEIRIEWSDQLFWKSGIYEIIGDRTRRRDPKHLRRSPPPINVKRSRARRKTQTRQPDTVTRTANARPYREREHPLVAIAVY